jgi:hypothetical protein
MLQTLTNLLADRLGDRAFFLAMTAALLGVFVWLLGARFGKSVLALIGVGLGAWLGLNLPRWYGWNFDGMALGMGGALVAGFAGYLLHTTWVGGALVINLTLLFAVTTWAVLAGNATWQAPSISDWSVGQVEVLRTVWRSMPGDLPRVMPYAVAMGVITAVAVSILWPRLAKAFSWSLTGLVLIIVGGGVVLMVRRPDSDLSGYLPSAAGARVTVLWGLAGVGMLVQWWSMATAPTPAVAPAKPKEPAAAASVVEPGKLATGGAKA